MKFTAALASLLAVASAQTNSHDVFKGFSLRMDYNAWSEVITFRVTMPSNTWFGLVLGSADHSNSDMIQFKASGDNSQVFDAVSTNDSKPNKDLKQDISFNYQNFSKEVFFTVTRGIDTQDPNDYVIKLGEQMTFGWALNEQTNDLTVKHTRTGKFKVYILTSDGISAVQMSDFTSPNDFPAGPIPIRPKWPLAWFNDTSTLDNISENYFESGGWTLDG